MVILNKHALASFNFQAPMSLLFFQCALAVVLVKLCELFGVVKLQPLKWDLVSVWFPVSVDLSMMMGPDLS
jgi:GDP-mannose transporter